MAYNDSAFIQQVQGEFSGNHSGFRNQKTGAGTAADHSAFAEFVIRPLMSRTQLEVIYTQSLAAGKMIDIPVNDAFLAWREFTGDDVKAVGAMAEQEDVYDIPESLEGGAKGGRLYGMAVVIVVTGNSALSEELVVGDMRAGDLKNLIVVDKFDLAVREEDIDYDVRSKTFKKPLMYSVKLRGVPEFKVHTSRVLQFDGLRPPSDDGWSATFGRVSANDERMNGLSELVRPMMSIMQDASLASVTAYLAEEASTPVVRMGSFREMLAGEKDPDRASPEEELQASVRMKSVYRTMVLDKEDEFERISVSFSGLPELMDRYARRLASAADIPMTRFWGQSPMGLNASGVSDMTNYALHVGAMQKKLFRKPLALLDQILAKNAGLAKPPEYRFVNLLSYSDDARVEHAEAKVRLGVAAKSADVMTPEEVREILSGDPVIGNLENTPAVIAQLKKQSEPEQMPEDRSAGRGVGAKQQKGLRPVA